MNFVRQTLVLIALAVPLSACGEGNGTQCETDSDCPSGASCVSNGGVLFAERTCSVVATPRDTDNLVADGEADTMIVAEPDVGADVGVDIGTDTCLPVTEECNGRDDDCDGDVDEDCECNVEGQTEDCYPASDPSTKGVGICRGGQRTCRDGEWGPCKDARTPREEKCGDGDDNDCDGKTNEGCTCDYDGRGNGVCKGQTEDEKGNCQRPSQFNPGEPTCDDGLDNDCDGDVDEATTNCRHWFVRILGSSSEEEGDKVTFDGSGNIYIVGDSRGQMKNEITGSGRDIVVAKFDKSGSLQWLRRPHSDGTDLPSGIDVDAAGNVYVTGQSKGKFGGRPNKGEFDGVLVKYSPSGNRQWTEYFATQGSDVMTEPVVTQGSIYVAGRTTRAFGMGAKNKGGEDVFVAKYSTGGNRAWIEMLGTSSHDRAHTLDVDGSGNVYVGGETRGAPPGTQNNGQFDGLAASWDGSGNLRGIRLYGGTGDERIDSLAVTSKGRIYVFGTTDGSVDGHSNSGGDDAFLVSVAPNGNRNWTRLLGSSRDDQGRGVDIDDHGGVVVTGQTNGGIGGESNQGGNDAYLAQFAPNGDLDWVRQYGGPKHDGADGLATNGTNRIYLIGETANSLFGKTNAGNHDLLLIRAR